MIIRQQSAHVDLSNCIKLDAVDEEYCVGRSATIVDNQHLSRPFVKNRGRVTKHARKVILTLDSRIQEQFDGLF
ncbi:hypothetical protein BKY29_07740 [Weissella confusa]|uniref:hypothetical protein n=1 Tax=Weissella confusa TaxID=1583 RepID=UPI0009130A44|nr:hypothetical protein [Weissella confusa]OJF03126.1 hypothetical protein BKY29_07740 [Weissella confusa]